MSSAAQPPSLQTYTIRDLCNEFEFTTRAVRFYEEQGLISPTRVQEKRIFSPEDRARLDVIARGRRIGLSIPQIREILAVRDLGGETAQAEYCRTLYEQQLRHLSAQEAQIKQMIATLRSEYKQLSASSPDRVAA